MSITQCAITILLLARSHAPSSVILWCHREERLARSRALLPSSSSAASAENNLGLLNSHLSCLAYAEQACFALLLPPRCSLTRMSLRALAPCDFCKNLQPMLSS